MSPIVPIIIIIIAISTFFILRWILKRFIKDKTTRNWTSVITTIITAPILYYGLIIVFFSYLFYEPQFDFEKERWFTDKNSRFEMSDDLVNSRILNGKTKSEIIELIGESENDNSTDIWIYDLGTSSAGFGWQFNSLRLTFKDGIVSDVKKLEMVD